MVLIRGKKIVLHQKKKKALLTLGEQYLKMVEILKYRSSLSRSRVLKLGLSDKHEILTLCNTQWMNSIVIRGQGCHTKHPILMKMSIAVLCTSCNFLKTRIFMPDRSCCYSPVGRQWSPELPRPRHHPIALPSANSLVSMTNPGAFLNIVVI